MITTCVAKSPCKAVAFPTVAEPDAVTACRFKDSRLFAIRGCIIKTIMVTAQLRRHRPISCGMRLAGKGVRCSASAPSGRQRGEPEIDSSAAHHARGIVDCELRHTPLKNVELD